MPAEADRGLRLLLVVNGVFNALGAVILTAGASSLDAALGIGSSSDFVWHLLAACSLSLAVLCFLAVRLREPQALRSVVVTLMVFNGSSALVSVWAILQGLPAFVWANTAVHVVFFVWCWAAGLGSPAIRDSRR